MLAGLGFIVGGSLVAPDPEPTGWVAQPAPSQPPYAGPGPTNAQVTADIEAATAAAGLAPVAPSPASSVPGCLAPRESYERVSDARLGTLLEQLNSRQWLLTGRREEKPTVASLLTKGTWQLMVVHEKRAGSPERLSLVAANMAPGCEEAFRQAQADGIQAV